MFLLDTDVISRTSPLSQGGLGMRAWLARNKGRTSISVVSLAELHFGVDRLSRRGASRKAEVLEAWLSGIESLFGARMHVVDARISRRMGELLARAEAAGHAPGFADACIAATADVVGLEVVTFNARRFAAFGVAHQSPGEDGRSR